MKVNVNSWHFKMVLGLNTTPSKSLCVYFWQVVWSTLFLCVILPVILLVAIFGGIAFLPIPIGDFVLWIFGTDVNTQGLNSYLLRLGLGYTAVILVTVLWILSAYLRSRRNEKLVEKKEDGIFVSYIKAKKRKICPILEFTDGGKDEN